MASDSLSKLIYKHWFDNIITEPPFLVFLDTFAAQYRIAIEIKVKLKMKKVTILFVTYINQ